MSLKITFFNWRGSMGKSTLSYLAYQILNADSKIPFAVVTNEKSTVLADVVDPKYLKILEEGEPLPKYPKNIGIIFDLGGFADSRVIEAISQSKCVIVPIIWKKSKKNYSSSLSCALETAKLNSKTILVANAAEGYDYKRLEKVAKEHKAFKGLKLPVFEIKNSTSMARVLDEECTLHDLAEKYRQHRKPFSHVANQFDKLLNHIKNL